MLSLCIAILERGEQVLLFAPCYFSWVTSTMLMIALASTAISDSSVGRESANPANYDTYTTLRPSSRIRLRVQLQSVWEESNLCRCRIFRVVAAFPSSNCIIVGVWTLENNSHILHRNGTVRRRMELYFCLLNSSSSLLHYKVMSRLFSSMQASRIRLCSG